MAQAAAIGNSPIPQGAGIQPFIPQMLCPVVICLEAFETSSIDLKDFASINNHLNDYKNIHTYKFACKKTPKLCFIG